MKFQSMNIEISAKLPDIPAELPVYSVHTASLEERQPAIKRLREMLKLADLITVDTEDSLRLEGKDGEIEFYRPSGSLWVENVRADEEYSDERRSWKTVEAPDANDPANSRLVLTEAVELQLAKRAGELFKESGLMTSQAFFAGVALDQVSKLDAEGKEVERFSGKATARYLYRLDGIEVDGPGAKTYGFYNPGTDSPELTGAYHAWREVKDKYKVKLMSMEESLERAVRQDPELQLYLKRGSSIELVQIDLVYVALGPAVHQKYVFPALLVGGGVDSKAASNEANGFEFSRFYHVATAEAYASSKLHAYYLLEQL